MLTITLRLVLFVLILALVCGAGIGTGFLLHWIVPSIGVEIGSLIGVIAVVWTAFFYFQLMGLMAATQRERFEAEWLDSRPVSIASASLRRSSKQKRRRS